MTLIELLFVVLLIGFLVSMIFPTRPSRAPARRAKARIEIKDIETAITTYFSTYERWPVSTNIESFYKTDFTFGTAGTRASLKLTDGGKSEANNSEIVSIITDTKTFRNGKPTPNHDGSLNPKRIAFLNAKLSDKNMDGIGTDGVYRDPWGNPYIVTIDLDGDGMCRDAFYSLLSVSAPHDSPNGINGLIRETNAVGKTVCVLNQRVMVWSLGQDGKADPKTAADKGVNKDNIVSWIDR